MSVHIDGKRGDVAERILLPGDPLRAKYIAETYLDDVTQYNFTRGMNGYTGTYQGKRVSVQGTGMGVPSIAIYVNELIKEYGVKELIRIGSCGGIKDDVKLMDIVIPMSASSDSSMNQLAFGFKQYAPTPSFRLFKSAVETADKMGLTYHAGSILTTDHFYHPQPNHFDLWKKYNVIGVEMESTALFTIAQEHNVDALTLLTVSDHVYTGEEVSKEMKEKRFDEMIRLALDL
jgi:purine-nucleoside phosphorylase